MIINCSMLIKHKKISTKKNKSFPLVIFALVFIGIILLALFRVFLLKQAQVFEVSQSGETIIGTPDIVQGDSNHVPSTSPTLPHASCLPRPACLDATPACKLPISSNMCPPALSATVALSFGSNWRDGNKALLPNSPYNVPIVIQAGTTQVTAANIVVSYDPIKVKIMSVTPGDFLPNILSAASINQKDVKFTYTVPPASGKGQQGSGILATLSIKPLSTSAFTLSFGSDTLISALGVDGNVLKSASSITITPPNILSGDFNSDGKVDIFDYNLLIAHYGNPYTIFDFNNLVANFGK